MRFAAGFLCGAVCALSLAAVLIRECMENGEFDE